MDTSKIPPISYPGTTAFRTDTPLLGLNDWRKSDPPILVYNACDFTIHGAIYQGIMAPVCDMLIMNGNIACKYPAVIDTGAYHVHISQEIVKALGLKEEGDIEVGLVNHGKIKLPRYKIGIAFADKPNCHFELYAYGITSFEVDILLGIRFLQLFKFYLDGKNISFELIYKP